MFRRHVLAALAAGIDADDDDAARAALARIDPVARGLARRKLERALIDAQLAATDAPPVRVMKLAALAVAAAPSTSHADVDAAYAALPRATMPRFPLWSAAAAVAVVAAAGAVAAVIATRPAAKSRHYVAPPVPESKQAFERGGVPVHDAAIDAALDREVTQLVVEAGRGDDAPHLVAHHLEMPVHAAEWRVLVERFADAVRALRQHASLDRAAIDLREAARDFSHALARDGLGDVVEGRIRGGYAYLQAYRVEEVALLGVAGQPRRVLSLRRLDHINTAYAVLGLHSDGLADPVLMLERIDEDVASDIIPVLAKDAPYPLAEREWLDGAVGKQLGAAAGKRVRDELAAALGPDAAAASRIAELLVARQDIIERWRDGLERRHLHMVSTDELYLPDGLLDNLDGLVPHYQREKVEAIEDELTELEAPRIAARVRELVAASVRRHEAEHGHDFDRDTEQRYPQPLADMLGAPHDERGDEVPIVHAARAELSAYLSQIANDPRTPHMAFWHLARQAFTKDRWGTGEMYAAYVVIEGLARRLAPQLAPTGRGNDRLAPLALAIAAQPSSALRDAAAQLWTELYGEPPTAITP